MIEDINQLIDNDFGLVMEMKFYSKDKFTQKEVRKMARLLGEVYQISHCIYCTGCAERKGYNLKQK